MFSSGTQDMLIKSKKTKLSGIIIKDGRNFKVPFSELQCYLESILLYVLCIIGIYVINKCINMAPSCRGLHTTVKPAMVFVGMYT